MAWARCRRAGGITVSIRSGWHSRSRRRSILIITCDGTPPRLLVCEFNAVGYELTRFERLGDSESYFASFEPRGPRPEPGSIRACAL